MSTILSQLQDANLPQIINQIHLIIPLIPNLNFIFILPDTMTILISTIESFNSVQEQSMKKIFPELVTLRTTVSNQLIPIFTHLANLALASMFPTLYKPHLSEFHNSNISPSITIDKINGILGSFGGIPYKQNQFRQLFSIIPVNQLVLIFSTLTKSQVILMLSQLSDDQLNHFITKPENYEYDERNIYIGVK